MRKELLPMIACKLETRCLLALPLLVLGFCVCAAPAQMNVPAWNTGDTWGSYSPQLPPDFITDPTDPNKNVNAVNLQDNDTDPEDPDEIESVTAHPPGGGPDQPILAGNPQTVPVGTTLTIKVKRQTLPEIYYCGYDAETVRVLLVNAGLNLGTLFKGYNQAGPVKCCVNSGKPGCPHLGWIANWGEPWPPNNDLKLGEAAGVFVTMPEPKITGVVWVLVAVSLVNLLLLVAAVTVLAKMSGRLPPKPPEPHEKDTKNYS